MLVGFDPTMLVRPRHAESGVGVWYASDLLNVSHVIVVCAHKAGSAPLLGSLGLHLRTLALIQAVSRTISSKPLTEACAFFRKESNVGGVTKNTISVVGSLKHVLSVLSL